MGRKIIDRTGEQYGEWTLVSFSHTKHHRTWNDTYWECVCSCGNSGIVCIKDLKKGRSTSCGCSRSTHGMNGTPTHNTWTRIKQYHSAEMYLPWVVSFVNFLKDMGEKPMGATFCKINNDKGYIPDNCKWYFQHNMTGTPEHSAWLGLIGRCTNINDQDYHHYGGRGISVCAEWKDSFENFYKDMGDRPSDKHSIDRVDNEGNYTSANCKWSTMQEQSNNRRTNRWITYNGETKTLIQWSTELGISTPTISRRLSDNWPMSKAFSTKDYRYKD